MTPEGEIHLAQRCGGLDGTVRKIHFSVPIYRRGAQPPVTVSEILRPGEVERLKREGVPPVPRPMPGDGPTARNSTGAGEMVTTTMTPTRTRR
jgi:hypothetical protein